ncbi:hypothetical protein ACFV1N_33120 [Streptosporangium canum]|uniref:hypothetical protein n=1 Tax=Streptosporangium canum TaxID=324952 RepID=UPI0036A67571
MGEPVGVRASHAFIIAKEKRKAQPKPLFSLSKIEDERPKILYCAAFYSPSLGLVNGFYPTRSPHKPVFVQT